MTALRNIAPAIFRTQTLILSGQGKLLSSCNTLFTTKNFADTTIDKWSLFLISFFESLSTLPVNQILILPRINSIADNVKGVFDFLFEKKKPTQRMGLL